MNKPRLAAVTILSAVVVGAGTVVAVSSDEPGAPGAPVVYSLKRPVVLKWSKVTGATSYRIWKNGIVVKTVTGLTTTVMIECTGNLDTRLNIQAQNAAGRSALKPPVYRTC
jgi:hypothetical protein